MSYVIQSSGQHYFASNALVALALNRTGGDTAAVYKLYQTIEILSGQGGEVRRTNEQLEAITTLSRSTISKGLRKLADLGLVELVYPESGNKAERTIVYHQRLSDSTVLLLMRYAEANGIDLSPVLRKAPTPMSTQPVEGCLPSRYRGDEHGDAIPKKTLSVIGNTKSIDIIANTKTKNQNQGALRADAVNESSGVDAGRLAYELRRLAGGSQAITIADKRLVRARLKTFSPTQLTAAVHRVLQDPAWAGVDERRQPYRDIRTVLYSDAVVESLLSGVALDPASARVDSQYRDAVMRIFEGWKRVTQHQSMTLTNERLSVIQARLAEGFTVQDFERVIRKVASTPWNRGENPNGTRYDDFVNFAGSRGKFERNLASADVRSPVDRRFTDMMATDAPAVAERS